MTRSWRCRVVWRPRPSFRRSPVAMTSRPASRFASVDLPVPDEPRRTNVFAGSRSSRTASIPSPVTLLTGRIGTPTATVSASASLSRSSHTSSFVSTITGFGSRVPGRDQVALETTRVEVLVEAGHEEHGVDVRDEDVLLGLEPGRLARDLRAPREECLDREAITGCVADDDPVADRGHPAPDLVVAHAPACARKSVAELRAHVVPAAMLRDDACGQEAALFIGCEGRLELIGPAEGGQGSIGHQKTPCSVGEPGRGSSRRGVLDRGSAEPN